MFISIILTVLCILPTIGLFLMSVDFRQCLCSEFDGIFSKIIFYVLYFSLVVSLFIYSLYEIWFLM